MKKILLISTLLILSLSCNKNNDTPEPQDGVIINDKVVLIKQSTTNLKSIDATKLIFSETGFDTKNIVAGKVLAGEPSSKAQFGYLRKVLSVKKLNGDIEVLTEQAAITDAIVKCDVEYQIPLKFDPKDLKLGNGVVVKSIKNGRISTERTQYTLSNTIEIGNQKGEGTLESEIILDIPQVKVQVKIDDSKIQKFGLDIIGDYGLGVNLKSLIGLIIKKDIELVNIPVGTIPCNIGIIPFYMEASLQAVLRPELKIGGTVEYGTKYTYKLNKGIVYENNAWRNIDNSSQEFNEPALKLGAEFSAKVELDLNPVFQPYGIDGFEIAFGVRPGIKVEPEVTQSYLNIFIDFIISLFVNIGVDFDIKLLGLKFKNEYERSLTFPPKRIKTIQIPSNSLTNLNKDQIAYYPFNGNGNDESGNGNNLDLKSGNWSFTQNKSGIAQKALVCNSTVFGLPSPSYKGYQNQNGYTISFQIKMDATGNGKKQQVFYVNDDRLCHFNFIPSASKLDISIQNLYAYQKEGNFINNWFTFSVTVDKGNVSIYINGIKKDSFGIQSTNNINSLLYSSFGSGIWQDANGKINLYDSFMGTIDEVRIYNKILTASEIQSITN